MVRIHAALVLIVGAFGISFLADPCGGGGDLCLGGVVGLVAIAYAGIGIGAIATWWLARRASPLLVWDSILVTLAGATLVSSGGGGALIVIVGFTGTLLLGVPGVILAGRAVAGHRYERILAVVALFATTLLGVELLAVVAVGIVALAIGWALGRNAAAPAVPPEASPGG
jgi:hypothetical protein